MRALACLSCLTLLLGACAAGEDVDASSTFFTQTTTTTSASASASGDGDGDPFDPETSSGDGDGEPNPTTTSGDGDGDGDPSTTDEPALCGNDMKEGDEECDGNDLGGLGCADFGFTDGMLVCADDCTLFTNACSTCGDGQIAVTEVCDGNNFGGLTCVDLGYAGGSLACTPDCKQVIESGCMQAVTCGNGALDPGESCDSNNLNGQTCEVLGFDGGTLSCSPGCQFDTSGCTLDQCLGPFQGPCIPNLQDCCEGLTCNLICLP